MPADSTHDMGRSIGRRVRNYLIAFAIVVLIMVWGNDIRDVVTATVGRDVDRAEKATKIFASIVTALLAVAGIVLQLGRDIDLRNFLDRWLFRIRKSTDAVIRREVVEAATRVGAGGVENMTGRDREVMNVFYHFANEQTQLRGLAFTYWEQYFVNLYVIALSALATVISAGVVLKRGAFDLSALAPALFFIVFLLVSLSTFRSLVPKILDLPIQQVTEIWAGRPTELKAEIEGRFGAVRRA